MTGKIILRPAESSRRREPLLSNPPETCTCAGFGEVAGGTAAVCCCCPFGIVNLLVIFVYKLPKGIYQKAIRSRRRRRLMKKGVPRRSGFEYEDAEMQIHPMESEVDFPELDMKKWMESEKEVQRLEKEMWANFYGTGFWRSPSQREAPSPSPLRLKQT